MALTRAARRGGGAASAASAPARKASRRAGHCGPASASSYKLQTKVSRFSYHLLAAWFGSARLGLAWLAHEHHGTRPGARAAEHATRRRSRKLTLAVLFDTGGTNYCDACHVGLADFVQGVRGGLSQGHAEYVTGGPVGLAMASPASTHEPVLSHQQMRRAAERLRRQLFGLPHLLATSSRLATSSSCQGRIPRPSWRNATAICSSRTTQPRADLHTFRLKLKMPSACWKRQKQRVPRPLQMTRPSRGADV